MAKRSQPLRCKGTAKSSYAKAEQSAAWQRKCLAQRCNGRARRGRAEAEYSDEEQRKGVRKRGLDMQRKSIA